jgi:hypothetical protein
MEIAEVAQEIGEPVEVATALMRHKPVTEAEAVPVTAKVVEADVAAEEQEEAGAQSVVVEVDVADEATSRTKKEHRRQLPPKQLQRPAASHKHLDTPGISNKHHFFEFPIKVT